MVVALVKLKLYVQNAIDSDFVFDVFFVLRFSFSGIKDDEFFLSSDSIVVSIDSDKDKILDLHDNSIIGFKLLLHSIKTEIVVCTLVQNSWRFQVPHQA